MTKREKERFMKAIKRLEERMAKKRDELRKILEDVTPLVSSIEEAADSLDFGLQQLREAADSFETAADQLSTQV